MTLSEYLAGDLSGRLYGKYKNSWAYIIRINSDQDTVILSNWRGIKTTTCKIKEITEVKLK